MRLFGESRIYEQARQVNHSAEGAKYESQGSVSRGAPGQLQRRRREIWKPGVGREARQVNHGAEGAKYESQGQARSASPL